MKAMFRSDEGRARVLAWHERFRGALPQATESRRVETALGETHLLVGGPTSGEPLVLLHGALASSAHVLHELPALMKTFRVYAIDIVGQSVLSAEGRPSVDDDTYGVWLTEVMDALRLRSAHLVGVSWGGFVAQRLAAVAPERIRRLVLLVPAGLVSGSAWAGFCKLGWPMMMYRAFPSPQRLSRFLQGLLSSPDDPLWTGSLGDAFLAYSLDMRVPRLTRDDELAALRAPTLVIAAEHDVSFPGEALLKRAAAVIPSLAGTELLPGALHCPPTADEFRAWLGTRIAEFLNERDETHAIG